MSAAAAVLFDLDGLLVDSEPLWTVAEEELAARLGGEWSTDLKAVVVGTRLDVSVPAILRFYGVTPTPAVVARTQQWLLGRMCALFAERLTLQPGAAALLDGLAGTHVPVGLVSSSYRVLLDAALPLLGAGRFALTVAGDEVRRGKPDPEPYLTACHALGVPPERAVVLEDSPAGVTAGEAAGCVVVAVPSVAPIAATPRRPVLASLAGVDPGWLLGLPELLEVPARLEAPALLEAAAVPGRPPAGQPAPPPPSPPPSPAAPPPSPPQAGQRLR